jgi:DEAD/DEAH box helicase domain-containing protein
MVAQADALDQYFIKYPEEFFGRPMETAVVDPDNRFVVKAHLPCAAQELPLKVTGEIYFDLKAHEPVMAELARERHLLHSAAGDAWFARARFPQKEVNIRGIGESFAIFQTGKKRPLGSIDGHRLCRSAPRGHLSPQGPDLGGGKIGRGPAQRLGQPHRAQLFYPHPDGQRNEILEVLATRQVARFTPTSGGSRSPSTC